MGVFDIIEIDDSTELPGWPYDEKNVGWQSKDVDKMPTMSVFRISNGALLSKENSLREMTDKELDERAVNNGYESWSDLLDHKDTDWKASLLACKTSVIEDTWWEDTEYHGTFEFHHVERDEDSDDTVYWSYEARFTDGELDKIVKLEP